MRRRIDLKIGRTLIVDGPATVRVKSGMVNVMGTFFAEGSVVKVRRFRRIPLHAEHSEASLVLDFGKYSVVEGSTLPRSWFECAEKTVGEDAGLIGVVGEADSGKTSLATLLVNYYLNFHGEVGVVDADPGQNDLGIPGTVSGGIVNKGLSDLSQVKPEVIEFLGFITPETSISKVNEAVVSVLRKLRSKGIGKIVINTDGWVDHGGLRHKAELMNLLKPSFIVSLLSGGSMLEFSKQVEPGIRLIQVEKPVYAKRRSREQRRMLRIMNYRRYFSGSRLVKDSVENISFLNHPFLNGEPAPLNDLRNTGLNVSDSRTYMGVLYVKVKESLEEPVSMRIGGKTTVILGEGWEKGLLAGLSREGRTMGVGVIENLSGGEVVVKTPVKTRFDAIRLGEIKLDAVFDEKIFPWRVRGLSRQAENTTGSGS
ncbi:MAG: Clp1/GlmU family protein [Thermoproteota archaeon]